MMSFILIDDDIPIVHSPDINTVGIIDEEKKQFFISTTLSSKMLI
jgi:hypothetical protein